MTDDYRTGSCAPAYRAGLADGRRFAAREMRAAILQLVSPDDPPTVVYRLHLAAEIASRQGRYRPPSVPVQPQEPAS